MLGHLVRGYETKKNFVSEAALFGGKGMKILLYTPLSFPRMNANTGCSPNRHRKYHDRLDTHLTSRSLVMTPDCNIDLNRIVNGNGSFKITYPAKKALIQPIIKV